MKHFPRPNEIHTIIYDFDGVFTDNKVYLDQNGIESVRCDRSDGLGLLILRKFCEKENFQIEQFILSKEKNPVVSARAEKLKLNCFQGVDDKLSFTKDYLSNRFGNSDDAFRGVIYLGNDLNDLPVMIRAGYSLAPADACERIQERATFLSSRNGGDGFLREFVERFLELDKLSDETLEAIL